MLDNDYDDEIRQAVIDSYRAENGVIRSGRAALVEFEQILDDAEQAHRPWPDELRQKWVRDGMRAYLKKRWEQAAGEFGLVDKGGNVHHRKGNRGTIRTSEDTGRPEWVQMNVLDWTIADFDVALEAERGRLIESQLNLGMNRRCRDLLVQTGACDLREALRMVGKSLDEFLNADAAAS